MSKGQMHRLIEITKGRNSLSYLQNKNVFLGCNWIELCTLQKRAWNFWPPTFQTSILYYSQARHIFRQAVEHLLNCQNEQLSRYTQCLNILGQLISALRIPHSWVHTSSVNYCKSYVVTRRCSYKNQQGRPGISFFNFAIEGWGRNNIFVIQTTFLQVISDNFIRTRVNLWLLI